MNRKFKVKFSSVQSISTHSVCWHNNTPKVYFVTIKWWDSQVCWVETPDKKELSKESTKYNVTSNDYIE